MSMKSETTGEAAKQRHIQRGIDAKDKSKGNGKQQGAMQAGARDYPEPPFPEQHQPKPGHEWAIEPAPLYDAPFYIGSKKLDGKTALITGGDSGIGRSVALFFAREGADIAIVYLSEDKDAEATKAAVEMEGRRCILIKADVSEREHCRNAVAVAVEKFGRIDVLVNNAAFQIHSTDFAELTEEHFDTTLKTNLYGYFHMAQEAVPHMRPGSAIINTGSVTGIDGSKALVDYSMTKGGIHAFTRALSGNLIEKGIRVNAVAPGPVWTPLNPSDKEAGEVSKFGADTPMKRPAQPEELAPAYVFLASPQCSSYITGEILPVVGGY
ncbi:SDR family oxidoreductase [Mesorhizobium neociceri]|uniref:SDR family oxidoreductase n=1 Tax=Mesorhizobium neociceri TaxID=1307853 RepID=A0A838BA47_9HYPH|nr:SDR family oxidoreductase [Mesorhizobium neociceri]MBA1143062.1 SDR family oxidoreductase [Mesorhizobium neociceri]